MDNPHAKTLLHNTRRSSVAAAPTKKVGKGSWFWLGHDTHRRKFGKVRMAEPPGSFDDSHTDEAERERKS